MDDDEILLDGLRMVGIQDVGYDDLDKPVPQFVIECFQRLYEVLSGTSLEEYDTALQEAMQEAEQRGQPFQLHHTTLSLHLFFRRISSLFRFVGYQEFEKSDLSRPEAQRFKMQLHVLIEFLHFAAENAANYFNQKPFNEHTTLMQERNVASEKLERLKVKVDSAIRAQQSEQDEADKIQQINSDLAEQLRTLKEEVHQILENVYPTLKKERSGWEAQREELKTNAEVLAKRIANIEQCLKSSTMELVNIREGTRQRIEETETLFKEEQSKMQFQSRKQQLLEDIQSDVNANVSQMQLVASGLEALRAVESQSNAVKNERANADLESGRIESEIQSQQAMLSHALGRLERVKSTMQERQTERMTNAAQRRQEIDALQEERQQREEECQRAMDQLQNISYQKQDLIAASADYRHSMEVQFNELQRSTLQFMKQISTMMDLQIE